MMKMGELKLIVAIGSVFVCSTLAEPIRAFSRQSQEPCGEIRVQTVNICTGGNMLDCVDSILSFVQCLNGSVNFSNGTTVLNDGNVDNDQLNDHHEDGQNAPQLDEQFDNEIDDFLGDEPKRAFNESVGTASKRKLPKAEYDQRKTRSGHEKRNNSNGHEKKHHHERKANNKKGRKASKEKHQVKALTKTVGNS